MRYHHWLNRGVALLSILGLAVSAFLTLAHLKLLPLYCESIIFDCGAVARHPLANGLGIPALKSIPTAAFGLLFFTVLAILSAFYPLLRGSVFGRVAAVSRIVLVITGLFISAFLSFAELFIIHAWCLWCVISAGLILLISILLIASWRQERIPYPRPILRARVGETFLLVGAEVLGVLICGFLLWQVKHYIPSPKFDPRLTKENLHLAECQVLGDAVASHTRVIFGSYRCEHCKSFVALAEELMKRYAGKLNVIFSPTSQEPDAHFYLLGAAAEAAGRQGKYHEMHLALFAKQEELNSAFDQQDLLNSTDETGARKILERIAQSLNLSQDQFSRDLVAPQIHAQVKRRVSLAQRYNLLPIPQFLFLSPNHPPVRLHQDKPEKPDKQIRQWLDDPTHW